MEKIEKYKFVKAGVFSSVFVGFAVALVVLSNVGNVMVDTPSVEYRESVPIDFPFVGDNNPGSFGWVNWSLLALDAFNVADTNHTHDANVYASYDNNDSQMASRHVPHSTPFNVTLKLLLNATWFDSDGTFQKDWIRVWCNASSVTPAISSGLATIINVSDQTPGTPRDHYYVYAVWSNGGSGYTIGDGVEETDMSFTFEGYFVQGEWNN